MDEYSIKPEWVDVEITEGVAMEGEFKIDVVFSVFDQCSTGKHNW